MSRLAAALAPSPSRLWLDHTAQVYPELPHYGGLWHAWAIVGYRSHHETRRVRGVLAEHLRRNLHSRVLLAARRLGRRTRTEKRMLKPATRREEPAFPYYMDTSTEHMFKTLYNVKEHSEL